MKILTTDHTALNVSDIKTSRRFYTEQLGFEEMERPDFEFDGVWYRTGPNNEQLHLVCHKDLMKEELPRSDKPRGNHHIAFRVADVFAVTKEIEARGVKIMMLNERPDGIKQLFIQDPDGYIIEFNDFDVENSYTVTH